MEAIQTDLYMNLNPVQDGHFWGCSRMGPFLGQYPTMMKLGTVIPYLEKIKKNMNHVTQAFPTLAFFHRKSANFALQSQSPKAVFSKFLI